MAETKLEVCRKCWGKGLIHSGDETSTRSKTCEDCHGSGFVRVPQTNADRIRAMSDEELANWLEWFVLELLDFNEIQHDGLEDGEHEHLLEMLKQPADMRGEEDG